MLNIATKKVEGIKRNVLFSSEKRQWRAQVLFFKALIQKMKGIAVDKSIMEKRKKEAKIEIEDFSVYTMQNIKELLEEAKRQ